MEDWLKEFIVRAEKSRSLKLHPDLLSKNAQDALRILAFAGFDIQEIIRVLFIKVTRGRDTSKVNEPSIWRALQLSETYRGYKEERDELHS